MKLRQLFFSAALLVLVSACASGGGGSAQFRREVGSATGPDAMERAQLILNRNHYEIQSQEEPPNIMILTHWRARQPLADEAALGITNAESRVMVTGRQRIDSQLGSLFVVSLAVENRVRTMGSDEWVEGQNTPMFREYAETIAKQLETEFRTIGVRRF